VSAQSCRTCLAAGALRAVRDRFRGLQHAECNGIETLKEIRRQHEDIAVVMITSSLDPALQDRAKKPFYPADIDAILECYYGLQRLITAAPARD
jgi:CheY-like chemotaxis protein